MAIRKELIDSEVEKVSGGDSFYNTNTGIGYLGVPGLYSTKYQVNNESDYAKVNGIINSTALKYKDTMNNEQLTAKIMEEISGYITVLSTTDLSK